jgi:hypothetical protein
VCTSKATARARRFGAVAEPLVTLALAQAMVAAERERCARICESAWEIDGSLTAADFAARVRGDLALK